MRYQISQHTKLALTLGLIVACILPTTTWGQASPQAEALFRDGKRLLKAGKFAEACAAFDGSERIEHNIATILSLADCREKNQQYATAWALFLQAESQTRSDPSKVTFNTAAKRHARRLESQLSYLTIIVPDDSRIPDLTITRDGVPVDLAEWNRTIPVDGGSHVIAGNAPGHESWLTTVTLKPSSDKQSVEVPKFKALHEIVNKPPHVAAKLQSVSPDPEPGPLTRRSKVGIGVATVGVVMAGIGVAVGLKAHAMYGTATAQCGSDLVCDTQADYDKAHHSINEARSQANVSTVLVVVGGAAAVTGMLIWIMKPARRRTEAARIVPILDSTDVGLAFIERF